MHSTRPSFVLKFAPKFATVLALLFPIVTLGAPQAWANPPRGAGGWIPAARSRFGSAQPEAHRQADYQPGKRIRSRRVPQP